MDDLDRQIERDRRGRNYSPHSKERKWTVGELYKSPKGEFLVLRTTPTGYLVEYRSGEWKGTFIDMPRMVGEELKTIEGLKLEKEEQEKLLDTFFDEFPQEYQHIYSYLGGNRGEEPSTESMVTILRDTYPPLFQQALNKYLDKDKEKE